MRVMDIRKFLVLTDKSDHVSSASLLPGFLNLKLIFASIQEDELNVHLYGKKCFHSSSLGGLPQCLGFMSREGYEHLLYRLVLAFSKRMRWMSGTVTGVINSPEDLTVLSAVTARIPDGLAQEIPASLVIGATRASLRVATEQSLMLLIIQIALVHLNLVFGGCTGLPQTSGMPRRSRV